MEISTLSLWHNLTTRLTRSRLGSWPFNPCILISRCLRLASGISRLTAACIDPLRPIKSPAVISENRNNNNWFLQIISIHGLSEGLLFNVSYIMVWVRDCCLMLFSSYIMERKVTFWWDDDDVQTHLEGYYSITFTGTLVQSCFFVGFVFFIFLVFCFLFFCFVCISPVSCVPSVASVSGLSILDCPSSFL